MDKIAVIALMAAFLSACHDRTTEQRAVWYYDNEVEQEIFMKCLGAVPDGPQVTKYNDLAEVIDACMEAALRQSYYCAKNCNGKWDMKKESK